MIHYFESLFSQDSWLNGPIQLHGQKGRRVMVSDLLRSSLVSLSHLCYSDKSIFEANFQRNAAELKRSSSADDTTPAPVPLLRNRCCRLSFTCSGYLFCLICMPVFVKVPLHFVKSSSGWLYTKNVHTHASV